MERSSHPDLYSLFTFKALKNLVLGVSNVFKYCVMQSIYSSTVYMKSTCLGGNHRLFRSNKTSVRRKCNTALSEFKKCYVMPGRKLFYIRTKVHPNLMVYSLRLVLEEYWMVRNIGLWTFSYHCSLHMETKRQVSRKKHL